MAQKSITDFKKFLEKEGAKEEYIKEAKKIAKQINPPRLILLFFRMYKEFPKSWISASFPWSDSEKGFHYWRDINKRWIKECDE